MRAHTSRYEQNYELPNRPAAAVRLGAAPRSLRPERSRRRRIALAIAGLLYAASGLLYLAPFPWWNGTRLTRGSDWMLNSGLNTRLRRRAGHDVLAILRFAAYPLWMWFGESTGRRTRWRQVDVEETEVDRHEPARPEIPSR